MSSTTPFRTPQATPLPSGWVGYAVAVAAVAVATLVRLALDPALEDNHPFITYFVAVAAVAWFGRTPHAVVTLVAGGVVACYLFVPPRYAFAPTDPDVLLVMGLYFVVGGMVVVMSHTMRRAAAAEADHKERLRTTLASIGDAVIATDRDGTVTYLNAVAESLTGWTNAEAVGLPLTQVFRIVNESTRQPVENPAERALKEGVVVGLASHTILISRDGTERPIEDSDAPIRCKDGEIVGSVLVFRDISERRRLEGERQEAQERVIATLENITDAFTRFDRDWRIVYVNAEAERLTGQQRSELLGRSHWDAFPTTVGTPLEAEYRRAVADQVTIEFEHYFPPLGRWFAVKGDPTPDGGLTVFFRDVTEQKTHREALAASEARYRAIGESIDYGVWVCDADGRNIYASESFLRLLGINQDQCSDFGWGDLLHPDDAEATIAAWKQCARTQGTWDRQHRFKGADGRWHDVLARGVPLRNDAGALIGWAGINLDISRLLRAEREVARLAAESERQRRLYETVLTNTPDFVYVFSLDHKVLYANESLIKMWGRGHDGAIGKTFLEIGYEPWHAEMHDREIDRVRATKQPIRGEVPFTGTHGTRQYDYIFVPVLGADGEVEAVAGTTRDVTDRKESEVALSQSEERLRMALNAARMVAWDYDPATGVVITSDNAADVYGFPSGEWVRNVERGLTLLHPEDVDHHRATLAAAVVGGEGFTSQFRIIRPDTGVVQWMEERGHAVRDRAGANVRLVGVNMDITARKRAEEKNLELLRELETQHAFVQAVITQVPAAIVVADADTGQIRLSNEEAHRIVKHNYHNGSRLEDYGDTHIREAFASDGSRYGSGRWPLDRALRGETVVAEEIENVLADQSRVIVRVNAGPIRVGEKVVAAVVAFHDITDRKLAERAARFLADASAALSQLVDYEDTLQQVARLAVPGFADWAVLDMAEERGSARRLVVAHADPAKADLARAVHGRFSDGTARGPANIMRTGQAEIQSAITDEILQAAAKDEDDLRLLRQLAPKSYMGVPLKVQGKTVGVLTFLIAESGRHYSERDLTIATDLASRASIAIENSQLYARLKEADRRKDEFLATLAHELRNPLAPIRNGLQIIRMAGANGTVEKARSMMDRQLTQLVRLVEDLLDLSRVASGKLELRKERIELRAVIDAAVETSRPAIEQAAHELTIVVPDEPIWVDGDHTRLAQVVSNLLNNSAKYTHRGGHVLLGVARDGESAVVSVKDDGIGIPPAMLDKVFVMFTQVDRTLEKTTGGLGIGLSLVKGLVEMHGGTITAKSEGEGQGSEFVVKLPPAVPVAGGPEVRSEEAEGIVPAGRRRVLVVDDNRDAADSLAQLLELLGNEVRTANDGEAGVRVADSFRPDVVLMDIGMPKLNGYEACRRIREQRLGKDIVLVALTGWGQDGDRARSEDAGFNFHLVKPVEFAALTKLLAGLPSETS
jgi:PAS domain S-box-containing protein